MVCACICCIKNILCNRMIPTLTYKDGFVFTSTYGQYWISCLAKIQICSYLYVKIPSMLWKCKRKLLTSFIMSAIFCQQWTGGAAMSVLNKRTCKTVPKPYWCSYTTVCCTKLPYQRSLGVTCVFYWRPCGRIGNVSTSYLSLDYYVYCR